MKILCYSSYYSPYLSGITTTTEQILSNLTQRHSVTLLTFQHDKTLKKEETLRGVHILRMPWQIRISKGFFSFASFFSFIQQVKRSEIIMINQPNGEALLLVLLARIFNKKVISLFHCDLDLGKGIMATFISLAVRINVFFQLVMSDVIVTYPDYLSQHFYRHVFRSKLKTCLPVADPAPVNLAYRHFLHTGKKGKIYISFIGRVSKEKGLEHLIDGCSLLTKKNIRYELLLAGPSYVVGEEKYFKKIKDKLQSDDIPYRFLGQLSRTQLSALYKETDVTVVPSVNKTEAISIVQLESMLLGTPVIASSLSGVRYPIQKTGMGILTKPTNCTDIANAIVEITKHRSRFTGTSNQKKAKNLFDKKKVFAFYNGLFS